MDLNYVHIHNKITWRKFLILLKGLPENSAFQNWLNDKDNRNFVDIEEVTFNDKGVKKK